MRQLLGWFLIAAGVVAPLVVGARAAFDVRKAFERGQEVVDDGMAEARPALMRALPTVAAVFAAGAVAAVAGYKTAGLPRTPDRQRAERIANEGE